MAGRHERGGRRVPSSRVPDPAVPPVPAGLGARPVDPRQAGRRVLPRHLVLRHRPLVLALTAAAATLVVVGAWLGWRVVREAYRASARGTGVEVHLAIPGYGEGSSPVPLLIDGTTEGGARVRGVRLLSQTDLTLTLAPGTYAIEAVGSPVTASGGTYRAPEGNYEVRVGDGSTDVTAPDGSSSGALEMRYDPVSPGDVTDDDLAAIRAWMVDEGVQGVDGYVSAVEAARRAAG